MIVRLAVLALVAIVATPLAAQTTSAFPTPIVGSHTRVLISTKDLLNSMAWWTRMGFSPQPIASEKTDSAITLSDGQVVITLVKTSMPSPVIIYRSANIKRCKEQLDSLAMAITFDIAGPSYAEIRLRSPNSVYIAVRPDGIEPPLKATGAMNPVCGDLTEYSMAAVRLAPEVAWWKDLGLSTVKVDSTVYPFVNMGDGTHEIGIHENKDIPSLALTYFMPDMEQRIDRLKKQGTTPIEEIPAADNRIANAIFRSPEGQLVFLFETPKP